MLFVSIGASAWPKFDGLGWGLVLCKTWNSLDNIIIQVCKQRMAFQKDEALKKPRLHRIHKYFGNIVRNRLGLCSVHSVLWLPLVRNSSSGSSTPPPHTHTVTDLRMRCAYGSQIAACINPT